MKNQSVTGVFPTKIEEKRAQKETAAPAGTRNGGGKTKKLGKTSIKTYNSKSLPVARISLVGVFNDDGHLFGWETR